jgi:hypothetical protein
MPPRSTSLKLAGLLKLTVVDSTFSTGNVGIGLGSLSLTSSQTHCADDYAASGM